MLEQTQAKNISNAVFFTGLGIVFLSNWWWPGLLYVVGASRCIGSMVQRELKDFIVSGIIFIGIPFTIENINYIHVTKNLIAYALILLGIIYLIASFYKTK